MISRTASHVAAWIVIGGLLAPVVHTVWVSFSPDSFLTPPTSTWSLKWYDAFIQDHRWRNAAVRSICLSSISALLSVAVGAAAAMGWRRMRVAKQRVLSVLLLLPILIPPAALGFGLLPLIHATGLWGTLAGLVFVNATLGLPVAFLIVQTALTNQLDELQAAAEGLGANRWQVLRRITLPILRPALLAAGIAVFVLTLNESLVSIFLATPSNETLPAVTWPQLRYSPSPLVAVASCVTAVIGLGGVWGVLQLIKPRRSGAKSLGTSRVM